MRNFFFLFFLVLSIVSVQAVDCSQTIHQDYCTEIQNSAISDEEKAYLLADIFSDTKHYPDHDLVQQWNSRIPTTQKPENVPTQERGVIKNAWMTILAIAPSVELNNTLYINTVGEVLTAQNYEIQLPTGEASGDCRTERSLQQNNAVLSLYVNDQSQSSNHFTANYAHNTPVMLRAEYTITVQTKVDHYTWQKVRSRGSTRKVCRYSGTEYHTDQLTIQKEVPAIVYNPDLTAAFIVKDRYRDTVVGEFNISEDTVSAELIFDDSSYKIHNYIFSERYDTVLTEVAQVQQSQEEQNLAFTEGKIVVPSVDGCTIKVSSFFQEQEFPCTLDVENSDFSVSLPKTTYSDGELVQLNVEPAGEYQIEYAGEEQQNSFPAQYGNSEIIIRKGNREIRQYIHVKNDEPLNAAFFLGIFGTINYTIAGLIKKYWGVAL